MMKRITSIALLATLMLLPFLEIRAQSEQASQKTQAATAERITNFKKALSVCLEAKDYTVKF